MGSIIYPTPKAKSNPIFYGMKGSSPFKSRRKLFLLTEVSFNVIRMNARYAAYANTTAITTIETDAPGDVLKVSFP